MRLKILKVVVSAAVLPDRVIGSEEIKTVVKLETEVFKTTNVLQSPGK